MAMTMAAASLARRSMLLRIPRRPIAPSSSTTSTATRHPSLPSRFVRSSVVLASMVPLHSVIASSRLVSKLPKDASACLEDRFANYLSPI